MAGPETSPAEAAERGSQIWVEATPEGYVTEVSVPVFGDGGIQRLHSNMPEPEPEAEI